MSLTNIKCLVPLFTSSISTPLQDMLISTHSLANNTFSSLFNIVQRDGVIARTSKCFIDYTSKFLNDNPANIVCDNTYTLIDVIKQDDVESHFILEPSKIVNGTMNIMGQEYNITESNESYATIGIWKNNTLKLSKDVNVDKEHFVKYIIRYFSKEPKIK